MDIGVGLDATLGLSLAQQGELSQEAASLGYTSIWTPESTGMDSFQLCSQRWNASRSIVPDGIYTGIAVSPVMYRSPLAFAMSGGHWGRLPTQIQTIYRYAEDFGSGFDERLLGYGTRFTSRERG